MRRVVQVRVIGLAIVVAALASATGCTYARARGRDALDLFDFGFTFSTKPQFGLYGNCPFIAPGGYAKVDGYYAGIGGGKIGVMEHHQDAAGLLLFGHEKIEWKDPNAEESDQPEAQVLSVGPLGMAADAQGNPVYKPQCAHYLHLGFIGMTGNLNYKEWPDFLVGWAGFDPQKDDGRVLSRPAQEKKLEDISARLARPRDGLQLLIRTDKATYRPDEPIVLDVQLINRSGRRRMRGDHRRDLSVYFEPFATTPEGGAAEWLFKFHIFEVYGGRPRYHSPRFKVPQEARADYYHHVTLPPAAFVGRRFILPPARERNWLEPGLHFIVVAYEVSDEFPYIVITPEMTAQQAHALGTDVAYTRVWTGKLYSNIVTFDIRRPRVLGLF